MDIEKSKAFISKSIPNLDVQCPINIECCDDLKTMKLKICELTILHNNAMNEIAELKNKIEYLRIEWCSQQEHLGKLQKDYDKLQNTLGEHSIYCATLGAVMGNLLWKLSRMEGAVENMLDGRRTFELIKIMDNSLRAFLEVYPDIPDPSTSNEYQFILACCGILTNISANPEGRCFILTKDEGQKLLDHLVCSLLKFSRPNGLILQRMILMIIYNVSINACGMEIMQGHPFLLIALSKILQDTQDMEVENLVYRLILFLTQNTVSSTIKERFNEMLPLEIIRNVSLDEKSFNCETAKEILENLRLSSDERELNVFSENLNQKVPETIQAFNKLHCKHICKNILK